MWEPYPATRPYIRKEHPNRILSDRKHAQQRAQHRELFARLGIHSVAYAMTYLCLNSLTHQELDRVERFSREAKLAVYRAGDNRELLTVVVPTERIPGYLAELARWVGHTVTPSIVERDQFRRF